MAVCPVPCGPFFGPINSPWFNPSVEDGYPWSVRSPDPTVLAVCVPASVLFGLYPSVEDGYPLFSPTCACCTTLFCLSLTLFADLCACAFACSISAVWLDPSPTLFVVDIFVLLFSAIVSADLCACAWACWEALLGPSPVLLVVGQGKIVDKVDGLTDTAHYIKFFQDNGFIK